MISCLATWVKATYYPELVGISCVVARCIHKMHVPVVRSAKRRPPTRGFISPLFTFFPLRALTLSLRSLWTNAIRLVWGPDGPSLLDCLSRSRWFIQCVSNLAHRRQQAAFLLPRSVPFFSSIFLGISPQIDNSMDIFYFWYWIH